MINQFIFVFYTNGSVSMHASVCAVRKGHGITAIIEKIHCNLWEKHFCSEHLCHIDIH